MKWPAQFILELRWPRDIPVWWDWRQRWGVDTHQVEQGNWPDGSPMSPATTRIHWWVWTLIIIWKTRKS